MSDKTGISWTDATWNPVRGCSRVSEGCRNCYAERVAERFSGPGQAYEGLVRIKSRSGSGGKPHPDGWNGVVRLVPEHLADPLRWRAPRRIFVNSMSDLFHEKLSNEQIAAVFGVMAACPRHTFQVLTKRAARMREWFAWLDEHVEADARDVCRLEYLDETACHLLAGHYDVCHLGLTTSADIRWPLPNVWIGVSVENQEAASERIPAAVRFLSCEPLLGGLEIGPHFTCVTCGYNGTDRRDGRARRSDHACSGIDWVIAGCESGPRARPCDVAWLRSLRDQCATPCVPYFLKQAVGETARCDNPPPDNCGQIVRYHVVSARTAIASCGCTIDGGEACDPPSIAEGDGSKRKPGGVIELPYLDGLQHASFPETRP